MKALNKIFVLICLICAIRSNISAQNQNNATLKTEDSLRSEITSQLNSTTIHDTIKAQTLMHLASLIYTKNINEAIELGEKASKLIKNSTNYSLCSKIFGWHAYILDQKGDGNKAMEFYLRGIKCAEAAGDKKDVMTKLNNIAGIFIKRGRYDKAFEYFEKGLNVVLNTNNTEAIALAYKNMAVVSRRMGNIEKALQLNHLSMKNYDLLNDKSGVAHTLNNIAVIYLEQGDTLHGMDYGRKSLELFTKFGSKEDIAFIYGNIGYMYNKLGHYRNAIVYLQMALKLNENLSTAKNIGNDLNNLGYTYYRLGDINKALMYHSKALNIWENQGDKSGLANSLNNNGTMYFELGDLKRAEEYYLRSLDLSLKTKIPSSIRDVSLLLKGLYSKKRNYSKALENFERYILFRDSLNNESTRKASIRSQLNYEYEKQAAADSVSHAKESDIKNVELAKQGAEIKAKKNQQYALFGGLALVIIFAGLMYNRVKITQKQKKIIENQKEVVEEQKILVEAKQKEILDSIQYARRIQMAIIPSESRVENILRKILSK